MTTSNNITNTTPNTTITKVVLQPGMKIALDQNGVPLNAEQLDGKRLAVTKSGDSLIVTMPDGSQTELVDFFITEDVTLEGDFWEIPADGGLTQTASGVIAQPTTLARAADAGVLGEEAIATDVSATEITEAVSAVVAETEPAIGAGGFGGVLAGLAGLGLAAGGGGGTPAPAAADTVLSVGIFAGPVLEGHQLRIAAYDVEGNVLSAEKPVVLVDGRLDVTIRGDYKGAVMLMVVDSNAGADYINEADGDAKDLETDLRAIVQVDGTGQNVAVNVTPLSELVVRGLPAEGEGATAAQIAAENAKVIKASGLVGTEEVALRDVVTTIDVNGDPVEEPNLMGQILAAISGLESGGGLGTDGALAALRAAIDADAESDTPSAGTTALLAEGALLVDVAYGGGTALAQAVDTTQPMVTITDDEAATGNIAGGDITYTLTFSEAVTDFAVEDISVGGGVAGAFTALSDTVYTLVVTPTAGYEGNVTVDVAGAAAIDAVGNNSIEATQSVQAVDMVAPTVVITSNVNALKIGETATITFTFSEAPAGFTAQDVTVTGGILSEISGSGITRTATFTPTDGVELAASITVGTGYTDAAANPGVAGETPVIAIDTVAPTVTGVAITSAEGVQNSRLNVDDVVSVTVTMSEAVTVTDVPQLGLVIGEDAVIADYTGGSGTTELTFAYTVLADQTDINGISISADELTLNGGSIVDAAGNAATLTHGAVADNADFLVDTTAPLAPTLALDAGVSTGASSAEAQDGAVTVDAEFDASVAVTFTSATDSERTVTKTVTGAGSAQPVSLTAENLTTLGEGTINVSAVATDLAGNPSEAATPTSFDLDITPPTVLIESDVNALKIGETALITFTFSEVPVGFTNDNVNLAGGGELTEVMVDAIDSKIYTATFTPGEGLTRAASITVNTGYTDTAGNPGIAGTTPTIAIDTLAPTVLITSNDYALKIGETATITFAFSEDPSSTFTWDGTAGDVLVTGGTLSAISGTGLTRTATFTPTMNSDVSAGITVGANYEDAAGNTGVASEMATPITIDTIAPVVTADSATATLVEAGGTANGNAGTASSTITFNKSDNSGSVDFDADTMISSGGWTGTSEGLIFTKQDDYGTATFDKSTGVVSYGLDNTRPATQALTDSSTNSTDAFTVTVIDSAGNRSAADAVFTITGSNDAAVIGGTVTRSLTESNVVETTSGTVTSTDVDGMANMFTAQTDVLSTGGYGRFSISTAGAWTYTTVSAHNELVAGTIYPDTFTVAAADGTTQVITINIAGTNDAAVIAGDVTRSLTESNAVLSTSGTLTSADVDGTDDLFIAQSGVSGLYGSFSINAAGAWSYSTSNAHNEFALGTTYTDTFTVAAADGTTQAITINIDGTNDAAVIAGDVTRSLTESDAVLSTSGTLTSTDEDGTDGAFMANSNMAGSNSYGQFSISSAGEWNYTTYTAHDEFALDTTYTDTVTVTTTDGTTQVLTVNIDGTNDAAVFGGDIVLEATEGTTSLSLNGLLTATDADGTDDLFIAQSGVSGTYGSFSITTAGAWTYAETGTHPEFAAGTLYPDTFTVAAADGTTQVLTVNIMGV